MYAPISSSKTNVSDQKGKGKSGSRIDRGGRDHPGDDGGRGDADGGVRGADPQLGRPLEELLEKLVLTLAGMWSVTMVTQYLGS